MKKKLMTQQQIRITTLALLLTLLSSCDPTYSITVTNNTNEPTEILVKEKIPDFITDKQKTFTTIDGFDIYLLAPNERMHVGTAIAEIDNDMPFEEIKIVQKTDTISATGLEEIKYLFDKEASGELMTPYNLTIK